MTRGAVAASPVEASVSPEAPGGGRPASENAPARHARAGMAPREIEGGSAAAVAAEGREAFASTHAKPCSCTWELRDEGGALECAHCGAPIYVAGAPGALSGPPGNKEKP
jgi:hypothetical protein